MSATAKQLVALHGGRAVTTSMVIAKGTENDHASVIKLVRTYKEDLEQFGFLGFEIREKRGTQGAPTEIAVLNERQATLLITYMRNNAVVRAFKMRLVQAFYELAENARAEAAPAMPKNPLLAMMVQQAMELDRVEQEVATVKQTTAALERRVASVEIKHRSGVPAGYLSKSHAHHRYSQGIAEKPFHDALSAMQIETLPYIHTGEDGYESMTYAYPEDLIGHYAADFIASAVQVTPMMCESPWLPGRRFYFQTKGKGKPPKNPVHRLNGNRPNA